MFNCRYNKHTFLHIHAFWQQQKYNSQIFLFTTDNHILSFIATWHIQYTFHIANIYCSLLILSVYYAYISTKAVIHAAALCSSKKVHLDSDPTTPSVLHSCKSIKKQTKNHIKCHNQTGHSIQPLQQVHCSLLYLLYFLTDNCCFSLDHMFSRDNYIIL